MTFSPPRAPVGLAGFVGAARDLALESGSSAFTVQQVVERAGGSLKGFYRQFPGKDDLLLALLEEDSRRGAELLAERIAGCPQPLSRLEAFVRGIVELATLPDAAGYAAVLVREYLRLDESRPADLRTALAPIIEVLEAELVAGMAAGDVRPGDPARDADTVLGVVLAGVRALVLAREGPDASDTADYVWSFCRGGLTATRPPIRRGREPT